MTDNTKESILNAAQKRLLHFGYHKTTMAEIADDAGMSAANLYRYFKNKQDIVAECASRSLDERLGRLRTLAQKTDLSAGEKLTRYALELIAVNHALAGPDSRVGELLDTVAKERPELIHAKNELHYALLSDIIQAGCASGELSVAEPDLAARNIHTALFLFDVPLFVGLYSREEFEQRAHGLIALLISGLGADAGKPRKALGSAVAGNASST